MHKNKIPKAQQEPTPEAKMQEMRWTALARTVMDFTFGTLWWIKETLWKELLPSRYDVHSTRQSHPGLSLRRIPVTDLYSQIPMLHGRSKRGSVAVSGLSAEDPDRITHFGTLIAPVPVHESLPWMTPARIEKNTIKPRLLGAEQTQLEAFVRLRGLI